MSRVVGLGGILLGGGCFFAAYAWARFGPRYEERVARILFRRASQQSGRVLVFHHRFVTGFLLLAGMIFLIEGIVVAL